jgi:hypothetical protein
MLYIPRQRYTPTNKCATGWTKGSQGQGWLGAKKKRLDFNTSRDRPRGQQRQRQNRRRHQLHPYMVIVSHLALAPGAA